MDPARPQALLNLLQMYNPPAKKHPFVTTILSPQHPGLPLLLLLLLLLLLKLLMLLHPCPHLGSPLHPQCLESPEAWEAPCKAPIGHFEDVLKLCLWCSSRGYKVLQACKEVIVVTEEEGKQRGSHAIKVILPLHPA